MTRVQIRPASSGLPVYTPRKQRLPIIFALLLGLAIAVVAVSWAVSSLTHGTSTPRQVAAATLPGVRGLSMTGVLQGGDFEVNNPLSFTWVKIAQADRYRFQAGMVPVALTGHHNFEAHVTAVTRQTGYTWQAARTGIYYWRVQASFHGKWGPYSTLQRFIVVPTALGHPALLRPRNRAHVASPVRLCWSGVHGAKGYYVWIVSMRPRAVKRTCLSLALKPGRYVWKVAAFSSHKYRFTGTYSAPARFAVHRVQSRPRVVKPRPSTPRIRPSTKPAVPVATPGPVPQPVVPQPAPQPVAPQPVQPPAVHPVPVPAPAPARPAPPSKPSCIPMFTC
jgi:hypothetical protein